MEIHLYLKGQGAAAAPLQPLWTLGRAFIFAGIWMLVQAVQPDPASAPQRLRMSGRLKMVGRTVELVEHGRGYSQLSSLLIIFTLGAVFVVAAVKRMLDDESEWFSMFFLMFCVGSAIFMSLATSRSDRAIGYVREQMNGIFSSKLAELRASDGERGIRQALQITGIDAVLTEVRQAAAELRNEVIVLGPERLNRPPGRHAAHPVPRCFIMMPFGAPWSAAVDRLIREACKRCNVLAVRGDDIFSPTDILDDIWRQIMEADFVIADVTDRNTNVFYELGMAPAVGNPVLILSQRETDVPIDLKTRRWLPYDPQKGDEFAAVLDKSIIQVVKMYHLRTPADGQAPATVGGWGSEHGLATLLHHGQASARRGRPCVRIRPSRGGDGSPCWF